MSPWKADTKVISKPARKRPWTGGPVSTLLYVLFVLVFFGGGGVLGIGMFIYDENGLGICSVIPLVVGVGFLVIGARSLWELAYDLLSKNSPRQKFRRSHSLAQAEVVSRRVKKTSDYKGNPINTYYITVHFETEVGRQLTLEGDVSSDIYKSCAPKPEGVQIALRYADEDPTVVLFEGE